MTRTFDPELQILIVDDMKSMTRVLRSTLARLGHTAVDEAADGATALQMLSQKSYDLVISDWNMEPMTGFELLLQMRASPAMRRTRFVMITADPRNERALPYASVDAFLLKPFDHEDLEQAIAKACSDPGEGAFAFLQGVRQIAS